MRLLGASDGAISGWKRSGEITLVLPRVYAFGHAAPSELADLWSAILYAGPGASLTGVAGAHRLGLLAFPATRIDVSTPCACRSRPGIVVHGRRHHPRSLVDGVPVAPIEQVMLDLAYAAPIKWTRKALAGCDYHHVDLQPLLAACRPGRHGSRNLRWAILNHDPRLARTNSPLEDDYLIDVCEALGVPKPDRVCAWIEGIECDAVYDAERVIVQLDGVGNHHSPAQIRRDRRNDMILRGRHWTVLRYTSELVHSDGQAVAADIRRELGRA